jgi:hypothetical protein
VGRAVKHHRLPSAVRIRTVHERQPHGGRDYDWTAFEETDAGQTLPLIGYGRTETAVVINLLGQILARTS